MGETREDFAAWYAREHPRLLTSLLLVAGDLDAAQEATDEAFARAFIHWGRVATMASRQGWTYQVALNVLRRRARRARVEHMLLARQARPAIVPAPAGEAWEAVRHLPPRQRTAVVLRFVADLTEEQVGVAMGVSRSTISSALADARRTLAGMLADPGSDPPLEVGVA
jgi:RNA polymerase sigma-70 factor (ECF subfamily)